MSGVIFNQSIEIARPRLIKSPYSLTPVEDWDNPVYQTVDFLVSVQPDTSTEGPVERPQMVSTWRMYTPPGTDIPELAASSRIRLGGMLLMDVVGQPARWPDPWTAGQVHHLEARLEVVDG